MKKILSALFLFSLSVSMLSCDGQVTTFSTKDEKNTEENNSTTPKITTIEEMENYIDNAKQYRVTYENGTKMALRVLNDNQVMVCSNTTLNKNYNPETDPDNYMSYNDYHGEIVIPESVIINDKEYMVTAIENNAFLDTDITSVIIPKTITTIEAGAFMHWFIEWAAAGSESAPLEKITVLEGNPRFDSRENCNAIIETATNTLVVGCKNTVIPEGVKRIGDWAFCNCDIASVTIPASVNEIGYYAFGYCYELTSVTLQNQNLSFNFEEVFGGSNLQPGDIKRFSKRVFDVALDNIAGLYFNQNENEYGCLFLFFDGSYMTVGYNWPEEMGYYEIDDNKVKFMPCAITNIEDPTEWIPVGDKLPYTQSIDNTNQKVGDYKKESFLTEKEVAEAQLEYGDDWVFMLGGDGYCTSSTLKEFKKKSAFDYR